MDDSLKDKWTIWKSHYQGFFCPLCKHQSLDYSNPKQDKIAGKDVIAVTCGECGHIELFDIEGIKRAADRIYKDRHKDTLW